MSTYNVVLIGYGQIGRSQHAPTLLSPSNNFRLSAIIDPSLFILSKENRTKGNDPPIPPAPIYESLSSALSNTNEPLHAVVIACPPKYAQSYAQQALLNNLHVLMEKPPGLSEHKLLTLKQLASERGLTLYTAYHSTVCPAMKHAKAWITDTINKNVPLLREVRIVWKESASKWHPGQDWITSREGFGVLDILCNPLSMLDEILGPIASDGMKVETSNVIVPRNWSSPISGVTVLTVEEKGSRHCCRIVAEYAWNHPIGEPDIWTMTFTSDVKNESSSSSMELCDGGAQIFVNGVNLMDGVATEADVLQPEYKALYKRFEELVEKGESEIRIMPLRVMNEILEGSTVIVGDDYSI